jgi:L-arabinose transport system substrate-binding protein
MIAATMFNVKSYVRGTVLGLAVACVAAGCGSGSSTSGGASGSGATADSGERPKIAFIVKQPEEPWFQLEWKFAKEAADKDGFDLITAGATDGEQVLPKIENAAAQGAKGLIICSPDVRLGPAILARANQRGMKLMSVDDQLVDDKGQPLDVHHLGISAKKIGNNVGEALAAEMKRRGWTAADTALILVTRDELDTAKERTEGEAEALTKAGFPADKIYRAPQKTTDVPGGRDAATVVLTQHPEVKHWLVTGMNDSAAMGAVRATEAFNIKPENVIGIGINGDAALEDLKKPQPTGLYGSILLQARRHGYDTAHMMYKWIKDGVEPPKITYTDGVLITRDNYKQILKEQGLPGA